MKVSIGTSVFLFYFILFYLLLFFLFFLEVWIQWFSLLDVWGSSLLSSLMDFVRPLITRTHVRRGRRGISHKIVSLGGSQVVPEEEGGTTMNGFM